VNEAQRLSRYKQAMAMQEMGFTQSEYDTTTTEASKKTDELGGVKAQEVVGKTANVTGIIMGAIATLALVIAGLSLAFASMGPFGVALAWIVVVLSLALMALVATYSTLASKDNEGDSGMKSMFAVQKDDMKDNTDPQRTLSNKISTLQAKANNLQQEIQNLMETEYSSMQDQITSLMNMIQQMLSFFSKMSASQ